MAVNALAKGEKEMTLHAPEVGVMGIIERLASDPNFDTAKLEKLIELHERTQRNAARAEFYQAYSEMQAEIQAVVKRGNSDKGSYLKDEDIQAAARPVMQKHGFMLMFATDFPESKLRVTGKLAHRSGHVETSEFISVADTSGSKNAIQALGSAQSYGKRYTAIALLNITGTDASDDNGAAADRTVVDPEGFMEWWDKIDKAAEKGMASLREAWDKSPDGFRRHTVTHYRQQHEARKARAAKAAK